MVVSLLARGPVGGDPTERTFGDKEISDLTGENDVVLGDGGISGNGGGSCTIRAGETIPGKGADRGSGCVTASDSPCPRAHHLPTWTVQIGPPRPPP